MTNNNEPHTIYCFYLYVDKFLFLGNLLISFKIKKNLAVPVVAKTQEEGIFLLSSLYNINKCQLLPNIAHVQRH